jgi:hypothetical protein
MKTPVLPVPTDSIQNLLKPVPRYSKDSVKEPVPFIVWVLVSVIGGLGTAPLVPLMRHRLFYTIFRVSRYRL